MKELHGNPTVEPHPKVRTNGQKWKQCQKWHAGELRCGQSRGGELDSAEGVRRCCKKNSPFVLSCIA